MKEPARHDAGEDRLAAATCLPAGGDSLADGRQGVVRGSPIDRSEDDDERIDIRGLKRDVDRSPVGVGARLCHHVEWIRDRRFGGEKGLQPIERRF